MSCIIFNFNFVNIITIIFDSNTEIVVLRDSKNVTYNIINMCATIIRHRLSLCTMVNNFRYFAIHRPIVEGYHRLGRETMTWWSICITPPPCMRQTSIRINYCATTFTFYFVHYPHCCERVSRRIYSLLESWQNERTSPSVYDNNTWTFFRYEIIILRRAQRLQPYKTVIPSHALYYIRAPFLRPSLWSNR